MARPRWKHRLAALGAIEVSQAEDLCTFRPETLSHLAGALHDPLIVDTFKDPVLEVDLEERRGAH